MSTRISTINDLMIKTDSLPCHTKYKLLLYNRFFLSKLSWHVTIADLSKTWVVDSLDNMVTSHLILPINATICSLILNKFRYGINLVLPSNKFIESQTVIRTALKSFSNLDIKALWADISYGTNLQHDQFQNTKQVLKSSQHDHEERIKTILLPRGLVISPIIKHSYQNLKSLWSTVQQNSPRNIFNFSIKYLNNTLPTRKNFCKWSILNLLIAP